MTPLFAATATHEVGGLPWWAWLALCALLGALYYVAECAWWPFAPCRKCDGRGRFQPKERKVWRHCRRCKGAGSRIRFGRKVWNRFAKVRKAAT